MSENIKESIKKELLAGKRAPEIRSLLIERGQSMNDHYDTYYQLLDELNLSEEAVNVPSQLESYGITDSTLGTSSSSSVVQVVKFIIIILLTVLVLGAVTVFALGEGSSVLKMIGFKNAEVETSFNADDVKHQTSMKAMASSARIYKNKLLDYGGVCSSIGIDMSVYRCSEDLMSYAIETRLSTGEYYCVDSTGFAGITIRSYGSETKCVQ